MQSPIALQIASAFVETLTLNRLPHFCSWPIQYALANLMILPEGQLVKQSYSHFLTHIEMFEYILDKDLLLPFTRSESSIFMLFVFKGFISLYKSPEELISESLGGAFHMGYVNSGNYSVKVRAGSSKLLLLTIRSEWMLKKTEALTNFKPLLAKFQGAGTPNYYLPDCSINREVLKQVQKMLLCNHSKTQLLDIAIDRALTQLTHLYHEMITDLRYSPHVYNQLKADEIKTYIHTHYADKIIGNSELAEKFNVSERQFLRLVKIAFDMPLHSYLLKLRMNKAILLLISSTEPIHKIAAAVGYPNPKYFSTEFKKFHHISPNEVHGLCL